MTGVGAGDGSGDPPPRTRAELRARERAAALAAETRSRVRAESAPVHRPEPGPTARAAAATHPHLRERTGAHAVVPGAGQRPAPHPQHTAPSRHTADAGPATVRARIRERDRAGTLVGIDYRRRRLVAGGLLAFVVLAAATVVVLVVELLQPVPSDHASAAPSTPASAAASRAASTVPSATALAHSLDDPASIWVVVNKTRPLNPIDYAPKDLVSLSAVGAPSWKLRAEPAAALTTMYAAFTAATGLKMGVQSAYRSYAVQVQVYNGWVASKGKTQADRQSARPGTSEHQTGFAVDVSAVPAKCGLAACFGQTPQGEWLAANSWKYGFILRYTADKEAVTGYEYEPWHFRYVGVELATRMHDTGVETLEEEFGLPAAPDYPDGSGSGGASGGGG